MLLRDSKFTLIKCQKREDVVLGPCPTKIQPYVDPKGDHRHSLRSRLAVAELIDSNKFSPCGFTNVTLSKKVIDQSQSHLSASDRHPERRQLHRPDVQPGFPRLHPDTAIDVGNAISITIIHHLIGARIAKAASGESEFLAM
jgi:hypothetical protein